MFTKVKTFNVNTKLFKSRNHKNHVANINFYFDNSKYFIHNCIFFNIIVTTPELSPTF